MNMLKELPIREQYERLLTEDDPGAALAIVRDFFNSYDLESASGEMELLLTGALSSDQLTEAESGLGRFNMIFFCEYTKVLFTAARVLGRTLGGMAETETDPSGEGPGDHWETAGGEALQDAGTSPGSATDPYRVIDEFFDRYPLPACEGLLRNLVTTLFSSHDTGSLADTQRSRFIFFCRHLDRLLRAVKALQEWGDRVDD